MPALIIALQDKSPHTRMKSAISLGCLGDTKAILPLAKALKDENELAKLYQKALDERLIEGKLLKVLSGFSYPMFLGLTFNGLEYVENMSNQNQSSKNIFVAFNFQDELNDIFNIHLNKAIEKNGFNFFSFAGTFVTTP